MYVTAMSLSKQFCHDMDIKYCAILSGNGQGKAKLDMCVIILSGYGIEMYGYDTILARYLKTMSGYYIRT